jgi:hypothetical protein
MSSLYHLEFHNKSVAPVRGDAIKIMRLYWFSIEKLSRDISEEDEKKRPLFIYKEKTILHLQCGLDKKGVLSLLFSFFFFFTYQLLWMS